MNTEKFLKDIDVPDAVDWHPSFNEAGGDAFEIVASALHSRSLTEHQFVNLVRCMFRLRFHVSERRAFDELLKYCQSQSFRVRSVAVRLAAGLIALASECSIPSRMLCPTREDLVIIEEGIKMGVDEATELQTTEILRHRQRT